jgi:hypothetical protein
MTTLEWFTLAGFLYVLCVFGAYLWTGKDADLDETLCLSGGITLVLAACLCLTWGIVKINQLVGAF